MRILIDMQGLQTGSRHRGIGRYTRALVKAMIRNGKSHEICLLLNGLFPETIVPIIQEFSSLLRPEQIKIWEAIGPTHAMDVANAWRRAAANYIRQERIRQIDPDIVLITTLFEGFGDNFIASIDDATEARIPVATILYDLIPLMNPKEYLADERVRHWYDGHAKTLGKSSLLLSISESSRKEAVDLLGYPAEKITNISSAADDQFQIKNLSPEEASQVRKQFDLPKEYLMYSGATDPRKNHIRLIQAYAQLPENIRKEHQLAIVGGLPDEHKSAFQAEAQRCGLSEQDCKIVGLVDDDSLVKLYSLCKGYIFPSWHEGFGLPALEAIQCGRPVIASNTSSLPEVIGDETALFDPFDIHDMSKKMHRLLTDQGYREALVKTQISHAKKFNWDASARAALQAIERAVAQVKQDPQTHQGAQQKTGLQKLGQQLAPHHRAIDDAQLRQLATLLAANEQQSQQRELLIDISELVKHDAHTGIQRVTRAILKELLELKPLGMTVRPVYATPNQTYQYVHSLPWQSLPADAETKNGPVRAAPGDIFLGLDLVHPEILKAQRASLEALRLRGVKTYFVIYDLIPILYPQYANAGVPEGHVQWLDIVTEADGAICISQTVASDVTQWLRTNKPKQVEIFQIGHFHLGADLENSVPTHGDPANAAAIESSIQQRPSFLMVGTLEPRKGYQQTVQAFELLWASGFDANLIMIGKPGWKADQLFDRIQQSSELNQRLFWLQDSSDKYLEKLYAQTSALIAASYCEGYGLPLIEAARHALPIIARDTAIFKEVAQQHASYFPDSAEPQVLRDAIEEWHEKWKQGQHPKSDRMPCLTWHQSANRLLDNIQKMDRGQEIKKHKAA
jgi:glycosyltransferase involved in cell wall biosynthesis